MPYITISLSSKGHQMSLDDLFDNITNPAFSFASSLTSTKDEKKEANETRTTFVEKIPQSLLENINLDGMIEALELFNQKYAGLINIQDKSTLYHSFKIPKRSGGLRQIDAPKDELMFALRELKFILETKCFASHHTAAFAYVKRRCALTAIQRHQANNSRWFLKLDFSNFFGNTTVDFLLNQLSMIFPYSEIMKTEKGASAVKSALSLCFLNGGLPQGTPISPILTNMMMIPVDLEISRYARKHTPHLCYTRYADDIQISSEYSFDWRQVQKDIVNILAKFNAPFSLKKEKTRYGSSSGRNWNLGLMLNQDNQITIGHKKKNQFKVMIYSLLNDYANHLLWSVGDVQELQGLISYYKSVEKSTIEKIINNYEEKFSLSVEKIIKEILLSK